MNIPSLLKLEKVIQLVQQEPVGFWGTLAAVLNVVQVLALPVAPWIHVTIVIAAQVAAILAARHQVTPTANLPPTH